MSQQTRSSHADEDPRRHYFEELAPRWDVDGQDPGGTVERLEALADQLQLQPGMDLLEVGCGTGQITGWLAARVAPGQVVAVDFAEAMLAQARRKQLAAEFRRADVCRDPLGQRCFDVVLCFHSFPHFRDQAAALRNLASALRPGGRLMVMHLAGSAQINAFHDEVGGAVAGDHLPSCADWECLLAQAGLQIRQFLDHDDLFLLVAGS